MVIPNTIVKIVNKYGEVVDFEISRITNSIIPAITNTDNVKRWIAQRRAHKYAETVRKNTYNRFYNLQWIIEDFFRKYCNFKEDERLGRLDKAFVTERLSILLGEKIRKQGSLGEVEKKKEEVIGLIRNIIRKSRFMERNDEGLFPFLTDDEINNAARFLYGKVIEYYNAELKNYQVYPSREFIMDMIEKTMKEIGEIEVAESFMTFREGKKKIRNGEISQLQFTSNGIHYDMCRRTLEWNIENECESIFSLNDWVKNENGKDIKKLIQKSEARYHSDVEETAKEILERSSDTRVIIIAGPSCSNKTTTTVIINSVLSNNGLKLKQLNVDDYFKDLKDQPKDEFGDYDFEMPDAIDMDLINKHMTALLRGETVKKPCYNFKRGKRDSYTDFNLKEDEILLIDCLHGLYRGLTRSVDEDNKFSIYIESMNILRNIDGSYTRWADIRMLKRMIRDVQHRGYNTRKTLSHWRYVRKGELKHIIPYIFSTDKVINSGIAYELPVLKKALENLLPKKKHIENMRDKGLLDPYVRGLRVYSLLDAVVPIGSLDLVPASSPLREFIGGSEYIIPHNE